MTPPSPPPAETPRGPDVSDASLRAALETERLSNVRLRQETERQQALLRRRPVRLVLSLDRRARSARRRARREAQRGQRRLARVRLLLTSRAVARERGARQAHLHAAAERVVPATRDERTVTLITLVEDGPARVPDTGDRAVEVVLVLGRGAEPPATPGGARIVRAAHKTPAAAAHRAALGADGDLILFTRSTTTPLVDGWLDHLVAAVTGDTAAAAPLLVHPSRRARRATAHDLRTRSLGLDIGTDGGEPVVIARDAGSAPDPTAAVTEVAAGTSAGLLVRADLYRESGGLGPLGDIDSALVDLCARLRAGRGKVVAVPAAMLTDARPVSSVAALTRPIDELTADWGRVVDRQAVAFDQLARHIPVTSHLLIEITVAAPSSRVAHRWGDWHLAEALAGGLRRLGHSVHVQTLGDLDATDRRPDLHIVLRGTAPVARRGRSRRVLWVISHPEAVTTEECDDADLVLVASHTFAEELRPRTSTPVEVLLQATDPRRFSPLAPDPRHAHAVAVVAMTRHVFRPVVRDAIAVGLRPAIYGSDWRDLVDRSLIVAPYVHNHRLPAVYSSVGVLLNDHWDTMRGWGFVSNRLFDALACETPIVSDHLPEIADLFGDAVATYHEPRDLAETVDAALDDPVAARRRAAAGREIVLGAHTFDHRAEELIGLLGRHELVHLR